MKIDSPEFEVAVRARCDEDGHRWTPGEVFVSGTLTDAVALDVAARLRHAAGVPVTVRIDSPGGFVSAARDVVALINAYRDGSGAEVRTLITRAESAAGVVAQAGAPRVMRTHGRISLHLPRQERQDGRTTVTATAADMVALVRAGHTPAPLRAAAAAHAASLINCAEGIAAAYAQRTGRPAEVWREAMTDERSYGAYAAVAAGLADEVEV